MKKHSVLIGLIFAFVLNFHGMAQAESKRVLMVVTSIGQIRENKPTGLWLEEFAVPYLKFKETGFDVTGETQKGRCLLVC